MTHRPETSNEITAIENALTNFEELDNYRLNRLRNIRNALNIYRNAYANYNVELAAARRKEIKDIL